MPRDSSVKNKDINTVEGFIEKIKTDISEKFHESYDNYQGHDKKERDTISYFVSKACTDVRDSVNQSSQSQMQAQSRTRSDYSTENQNQNQDQEEPWRFGIRTDLTNMIIEMANHPDKIWDDYNNPDSCFRKESVKLWGIYEKDLRRELLGETAKVGSRGSNSAVNRSEDDQTDDSVSDFSLGGK